MIILKNIEVLNICYKFINRLINADELLDKFNKLDKKVKDDEEINNLYNKIKKLSKENPNEMDEYVTNVKEKTNDMIKKFENISKEDNNFTGALEILKKDYNKEIDSHKRWASIAECIIKDEYFNRTLDSLSDYELLEFITQYIQVPIPVPLKQEDFDRLVKIAKEKDEREWLWRLAFNYEGKGINFDEIVNYFIDKKDGFYLGELISAVGKYLNIDSIIDKINDRELIEDLKNRKGVIDIYVTEEQFNKLISKI